MLSHPGFDSESRSVEVSFEMASPQRRSSPSESHSLISPIGWQRNGHSQVLVPRAYLRTTGIHRKHSCFMFQRRPGADIVLRSRASRPQQQEVRTCRGVSVDRRNAPFIKHSLSYNTRPSFFFGSGSRRHHFVFNYFSPNARRYGLTRSLIRRLLSFQPMPDAVTLTNIYRTTCGPMLSVPLVLLLLYGLSYGRQG